MTWYNDHTHQLMVAIGTSQGDVVVIYPHTMSSFTIKQDNAITMYMYYVKVYACIKLSLFLGYLLVVIFC